MFWATVSLVLALGLYLLPSMVAAGRNHPNGTAITVLNVLLGWTVLGWVVALVWSLTGQPAPPAAKLEAQTRCPECREIILAGARKCKHCGTTLAATTAPSKTRPCPDCNRPAPLTDKFCPACGHAMAPR